MYKRQEIDVTVIGVRKLGHNIIWEVDKLNKQHATFEFLNETVQGKVDSVPHVIRLGRSKDKITSNSLTCKVQLMGCEIKQIRRILDKFKSIFPSKRVRFKTEKNLYKKLRNKCQDIGVRMCSDLNMSIQV